MAHKHKCPKCGKKHSEETIFDASDLYDKVCNDCLDKEGEGDPVECSVCGAVEYVGGEISEETLEGDGWYLGTNDAHNLCPEHNDWEEED